MSCWLNRAQIQLCYFSVCGDFKDLMQFKTRHEMSIKKQGHPCWPSKPLVCAATFLLHERFLRDRDKGNDQDYNQGIFQWLLARISRAALWNRQCLPWYQSCDKLFSSVKPGGSKRGFSLVVSLKLTLYPPFLEPCLFRFIGAIIKAIGEIRIVRN